MTASARSGVVLKTVVLVLVAACSGGSGTAGPASGSVSAVASASTAPVPAEEAPSPTSPPITPPPTPALSPVPIPPLTQMFRSPTMGYTVRYPAGWKVVAATEPWLYGALNNFDAANGDRIQSAAAGFRGGSQPLLAGQTAAGWIDAYMATQDSTCGQFREQIPLGRYQATIGLNGCRGLGGLGGTIFDLVVVVGRRAYNFTTEGAIDRAFLMALLATITFEPSSARD
jgi:hypothetical protein